MYLNIQLDEVGWKDFDEFKDAHSRVYSENPDVALLGCQQLLSWDAKTTNHDLLTSTASISNYLALNKKKRINRALSSQMVKLFKSLALKYAKSIPQEDINYKSFIKYADIDASTLPPLKDMISTAEIIFNWLNTIFWIPALQNGKYQRITDLLTQYFKGEITFDGISFDRKSTKYLLELSPFLIKSICEPSNPQTEDIIFGVNRSVFLEKLPNFISCAEAQINQDYRTAFALELADYLLKGSENASNTLEYLINENVLDEVLIVNYLAAAPKLNQTVNEFLQTHQIETERDFNVWQYTQIGDVPYECIEPAEYEIDESMVVFLEKRKQPKTHPKISAPNKNNPLTIEKAPKPQETNTTTNRKKEYKV